MKLTSNVGTADRIVRFILAAVLAGLYFTGETHRLGDAVEAGDTVAQIEVVTGAAAVQALGQAQQRFEQQAFETGAGGHGLLQVWGRASIFAARPAAGRSSRSAMRSAGDRADLGFGCNDRRAGIRAPNMPVTVAPATPSLPRSPT